MIGLRFTGVAVLCSLAAAVATTADAQGIDASRTFTSSYLLGRFALSQKDFDVAARFYGQALDHDTKLVPVLASAFETNAAEGNWEHALPLASQVLAFQPDHSMANLAAALDAFKRRDLARAQHLLSEPGRSPVGQVLATLVRAWVSQSDGKTNAALKILDDAKLPKFADGYVLYHRALIADVAGRTEEARRHFDALASSGTTSLRSTLAHAQHAAHAGDAALARTTLKSYLAKTKGEPHPSADALLAQIDAQQPVPLLISTPTAGIVEACFGLGEALAGEGGGLLAAIMLQSALYLDDTSPFPLAALAHQYEAQNRHEAVLATYDRMPKDSPMALSVDLRKGAILGVLKRYDDAKALLEPIALRDTTDVRAYETLGSIMRTAKRHDEAIDYFSRVISRIKKLEPRHWTYYYQRGTSYERTKRWPQAEADLQMALKLAPEQTVVLNYLGYSWIERKQNVKQAMALIEKAVSLKPDDGYIVDSLGWAHFRQGNFKEAVHHLDKAAELRPDDPTLNDHLGDALWRDGRQREAREQWQLALTLNPEPEDASTIKRKLEVGLGQP